MAHLDHKEAFEELRERTLEGLQAHFPVRGRLQTLELEKVEVPAAAVHSDDIRGQLQAKVEGRSWSTPIYGTLALKNNETGAVVDRKRIKVADLPVMTRRYSYVIDGQEYQVDNQWQLKPGAYVRRRQSGEVEARFNIPNKPSFDVTFDPKRKLFMMDRGKSEAIPVYPLMKALGVDDDTLEREWGKDVLEANRTAKGSAGALAKFFKADRKRQPTTPEEAAKYFTDTMAASRLRPDSTEVTLGKPFEAVEGDALTRATSKMLKVQLGAAEDDRDSLVFKDLRGIGDYTADRLTNYKTLQSVQNKMLRKVNQATAVRDVIKFDFFNEPIRQTFRNNLARTAAQINPVEMIASSMRTTIMGPGGISSVDKVVPEAKLINNSHFGFLDPLHTPESASTGITLHLPMGVKKVGKEPVIPLYNTRTGKMERVSPRVFMASSVVLPDQVDWKDGRPVPIGKTVKVSKAGNEIDDAKFADAQYVMRHSSQLFDVTSNLIPFVGNTSGNRASYATHHIDQAISLDRREAPLVQVSTGSNKVGLSSFEELLGRQTGHTAPVDGKVVELKKDAIILADKAGKRHEVQIYRNFPLNDAKAVLDSTPIVKVGDSVKSGQAIADTNFTRGGQLALGTNLTVAYVPFRGYNFEDGVVISRTAAEKLSSVHLHKPVLAIDDKTVTDPKRFAVEHPESFSRDQYKLLDDRGVVRVGQRVKSGDPLVLATRPFDLKDKTGRSAIRKSNVGAHTDMSMRWDSDYEGEVVGVHRNKSGETTVHVRTIEPMQVGDKLAGRHGNKGICFDPKTQVLTDSGWKNFQDLAKSDKVCTLNQVTREIEYQVPTRYIEQDHDGPMYRFQGRRLDLMTTPNHRHFVRKPRSLKFQLESASSCFGSVRVHLRTGTWVGAEAEEFTVPGRPRREGSKQHHEFCSSRSYRMDDFLEFFGYWLTEGCLGDGSHITIGQRQSCNSETYEAIAAVLSRLGYSYHEHADGFVVSDPRLYVWLQQFGKSLTKFIPREFLNLSQRQLRILADAAFAGDGGVYFRPKDNHTRHELYTSSARLADDYQELALKLGMSANIKPQEREGRENIEYVVRWSLKDEVYTQKDTRYSTRSEEWVEYKGKVYCVEVPNHVIYVRRQGIPVWSGNCTQILPDAEMPRTKGGTIIEVALNPSGVPGRVNVGQVLETAAAKIAKKTGKTYLIENLGRTDDVLTKIQNDLKRHGLEDTEELIDPTTGYSLGRALTGPQHMLKLTHQVDKKISARSGMTLPGADIEHYDRNLMPVGGGKTGAQSIGNLGMYVMLAHGAKANIREMQTWKSEGPDPSPEEKRWPSQHEEVWKNIQFGDPLPTPRTTFAFQKFTDMLRVAGVNVEKKGHRLQASPLTDAQILHLSNGEVKDPSALTYAALDRVTGEPKPVPGGLFDPKITGGHGGKKWSHFTLAEPMPNPLFEGAIQKVLGLKTTQYSDLVTSEKALDPRTGHVVPLGTKGSLAGGPAIVHLLQQVDVKKELAKARKELDAVKINPDTIATPRSDAKAGSTQKLDQAVKRVKYLAALDNLGMTAEEAYTLKHVPVLPPAMRPGTLSQDGNMQWADLNGLYKDLGALNNKMRDPAFQTYLNDADKKEHRAALYDGLKALVGVGENYAERQDKNKGVLLQIAGRAPKEGYFQKTLLSRRQDLSMRSTIIPEPAMGLDQVGLPTERALTLFRPFVVKRLVDLGAAKSPLEAQNLLAAKGASKDPQVLRALDLAMEDRPILLKRDPALHKHSIMAFNAFRVPGRAIQIHPLVTGGFNADFDGDAMSAYVPIHPEAVEEARGMLPTNNLFNEATGKVMHVPTLESALGLYKLSRVVGEASKTFANPADAIKAVESGSLKIDQLVDIKGVGKTTVGRVLISSALPEPMQKKMLSDHKTVLDKKGLGDLYGALATDYRGDFGDAANKLKDFGYGAAFGLVKLPNPSLGKSGQITAAEDPKARMRFLPVGTHTLSLEDFKPDKATRDAMVTKTKASVARIQGMNLTSQEKEARTVEEWTKTTRAMVDSHMKKSEAKQDNLFQMLKAGVKPGPEQYQQIKLAPMLLQDSTGRTMPNPVTKSYSEGLDVAGYWTQMHGARKGSVQKVQEVMEPGAFSKMLVNTAMGLQINGADCGTTRGIGLPVSTRDIYDRTLAVDTVVKGRKYPKGTVLSPDIVSQLRAGDPKAQVVVRSALKCEHEKGLCQSCAGISPDGKHYGLGTNLGILSAQSLGERAVQITLKAFHSGGVAGGNDHLLAGFGRIQQLTELPKNIPNAATIAMKSGTISKVEHERLGSNVTVGDQVHFVPLDRAGRRLAGVVKDVTPKTWSPPKVGQRIEAGASLSDPARTVVNPHDLYRATKNIEKVQGHLVNELHRIYNQQGVRRQHVETVVKAMSNLTRVVDPGDAPGMLRGEFQPTSAVRAMNRNLTKQGKRPVNHAPTLKGVDIMPLEVQEDWLAKMNFQRIRGTLAEAAATGAYSDLKGTNPIPGMVYGARFGMTDKHKGRDPDLAGVPDYGY